MARSIFGQNVALADTLQRPWRRCLAAEFGRLDGPAVQTSPGQSRALARLPCRTRLFLQAPRFVAGMWGAAASAARPTSPFGCAAPQAAGRSQVLQFPISAGSYLPEKSQAKGSAISFPTQGSGRERRAVVASRGSHCSPRRGCVPRSR